MAGLFGKTNASSQPPSNMPNSALLSRFLGSMGAQDGILSRFLPSRKMTTASTGTSGGSGMQTGPYQTPGTMPSAGPGPGPNGWWELPGSEPYRRSDVNSSLPIWQQLGYYDKQHWQEHGKPTESGIPLPSLTDPKTGIYHYELYTPEYQNALLKANHSNYLWRPTTSPPLDPLAAARANLALGPDVNTGYAVRGISRPIPWWMTGGSGVNPNATATPLWQSQGYASRQEWRQAGKPGR